MTAVKLSDQRGTGGSRVDRRCTISAVKDEAMGANGQPAYVQVHFYPVKGKFSNASITLQNSTAMLHSLSGYHNNAPNHMTK